MGVAPGLICYILCRTLTSDAPCVLVARTDTVTLARSHANSSRFHSGAPPCDCDCMLHVEAMRYRHLGDRMLC